MARTIRSAGACFGVHRGGRTALTPLPTAALARGNPGTVEAACRPLQAVYSLLSCAFPKTPDFQQKPYCLGLFCKTTLYLVAVRSTQTTPDTLGCQRPTRFFYASPRPALELAGCDFIPGLCEPKHTYPVHVSDGATGPAGAANFRPRPRTTATPCPCAPCLPCLP